MAAPLESSSNVPSKPRTVDASLETKKVTEKKDAPAQKVLMITALLSLGVIRPALSVLAQFPYLVDVHREIADLILRILMTSIAPLYESIFGKERNLSFLRSKTRYSSGGTMVSPSRKPFLTLTAPTPPSTHTQDFVFFFPQWSSWVPLCHTMHDLIDVIEPLMKFIGVM